MSRDKTTGPGSGTSVQPFSPLRVLMIAAEAAPYAKVGGLGDVTGTLPRRLAESGLDVAVVLPCYRTVLSQGYRPRFTGRQVDLSHAGVRRSSRILELSTGGVRYWFIQEDAFYDRDGVYGPPGGEYPDSAERFSFLSRAAVQAADRMSFDPDVVHCHDWHAALAFFYMTQDGMDGTGKLLTIHNLAYQGVFDTGALTTLTLPGDIDREILFDHSGNLNFLKAGMESADMLTTVSPTYAAEIQSPGLGCGLEDTLRKRSGALTGVLNGIDFDEWDPGKDPSLTVPFTAEDCAARPGNREALLNELGLDAGPRSPVMAFVGRLVHQKGADVLAAALPGILAENVRVILLGTGDPALEGAFRSLSDTFRGRVSVTIGFDDNLARRIYGGSDFFLMPSRFEPCGLGQMIAMRYGSIPIVRATGGLKDTVVDLDAHTDGNGLVFNEVREEDLLDAVRRAVRLYNAGHLDKIRSRIMALDNSWRKSAGQYEQLYKGLIAGKRG